ncbi:MAG: DUF1844 domain-containing protein [bacterium]
MTEQQEKKGYSVIDRRQNHEPPPAADAEKKPAERAEERPPADDESRAPEEEARLMKMEEFTLLFLNLIRDQTALYMGIPLHPELKVPKQTEKAEFLVSLANKIIERFGDRLFTTKRDVAMENLAVNSLILQYLGILREHVFIHLGLLANPATGLVTKDTDQARTGIDLFSLIVQECGKIFTPDERRAMETLLSELQLNFTRQAIV